MGRHPARRELAEHAASGYPTVPVTRFTEVSGTIQRIVSLYTGVRQRTNTEELTMMDLIRRTLHRLDRWTLTVFNPYYASDHRR